MNQTENQTDERFMREALQEAENAASENEVPIGAVVVRDNVIIARAHNMRVSLRDPTAHAEILALREAAKLLGDWRLNGCRVFVTLEPCAMCAGAIAMARADELVFGAYDAKMGCAVSVHAIPNDGALGFSTRVTGGVLEEECAQIISSFMKKLRGGEIRRSSLYAKPTN